MVAHPQASSSPLKNGGWGVQTFPLGAKGLFSGAFAVSFKEGNI